MLTKTDTSIVLDSKSPLEWCVFEYQAVLSEGAPPTVIMVGATRLNDVFTLSDGKSNSQWQEIFKNGGKLLLRIVATSPDKHECFRHAHQLMREHNPICNMKGRSLKNARRPIVCINTDVRYETQALAAADLGLAQSAISRHLRGGQKHVSGFMFAYVDSENVA